jgi:hypothetical protein
MSTAAQAWAQPRVLLRDDPRVDSRNNARIDPIRRVR